MSITQREIAKQLGVSTMTVSRALTGKTGNKVSAELIQKIKAVAKFANYHENRLAKAMRTGVIPLSALCLYRTEELSDRLGSYWFDLVSHYTRTFSDQQLEILFIPFSTTDELAGRLNRLNCAGLISSISANIIPGESTAEIEIMKSIGLPYVLLGHPEDETVPYVYVDNSEISVLLLDILRDFGAEKLNWFQLGLPLPTDAEAADPKLFFQVPGPTEVNILTRLSGISEHRIFIVTSDKYNLASHKGFLIKNHTKERCRNAYKLMSLQMQNKPLPKNLKLIKITNQDITKVYPVDKEAAIL